MPSPERLKRHSFLSVILKLQGRARRKTQECLATQVIWVMVTNCRTTETKNAVLLGSFGTGLMCCRYAVQQCLKRTKIPQSRPVLAPHGTTHNIYSLFLFRFPHLLDTTTTICSTTMMRSFSFLFFWALIQHQANGDTSCPSRNWSILLVRFGNKEEHCTPEIESVIDAQLQACVNYGSDGILNNSGHRHHDDDGSTRRRGLLLANQEPRRKLRTAPLHQQQSLTTPALPQQQQRELQVCSSCDDCGALICQILAAGGAYYCADTCGSGSTCMCRRRLEPGDNQDQDSDQRDLGRWDGDAERGSCRWYERRITRRCKWILKAFAEDLSQDADHLCLGDPDLLDVTGRCMD